MGTINYKTSDYITIGYNCDNIDYEEYEYSAEIIEEYYNDLQQILKDYRFYYFHVTIDAGYYEGFSIDIENNYPYCFDDYIEKQDAQKEITKIKAFLLECVNNYGLCAVSPGWCTKYASYNDTIAKIKAAVREMRQAVRTTPTWNRLPHSEKYA